MPRNAEPPSGSGPRRGFVSLVGAGPGSPDLLTLRGLRALEQADVILYDALLEPGFAKLFPEQALALPAGKRCGGFGITQERIHELLLEHARAGHRVVRLKGGDPFVFGRGGEEAKVLAEAGIPFEVIPGVSALQGAAAASGIPITHRGVSREVRILEGHHLLASNTNWFELARTEATLAIFMGTRSLQAVARRLLDHGADPDLPVALVERAFCEGQATTISTLRLAAEGHVVSRTEGPGLVYLGAAIRHRVPSLQPESSFTQAHDTPAALPRSEREAGAAGGGRKRRAG
ncbi:uroporphyrin-III C-methyltransferase [Geothrix limicola]|uniref:uroporphyrinogen-III C-methyltransferase n=1 Tax=Geothrix limicola TaxID=2927978 RepID=A0ABQ5QDL6_9BACT|nr:uroporphyrinogen-III C-methyltransferase [Geothrix limicola]GLH72939.1 uroporphyrin-III C-methyltransferase [Geothrix limicola]